MGLGLSLGLRLKIQSRFRVRLRVRFRLGVMVGMRFGITSCRVRVVVSITFLDKSVVHIEVNFKS